MPPSGPEHGEQIPAASAITQALAPRQPDVPVAATLPVGSTAPAPEPGVQQTNEPVPATLVVGSTVPLAAEPKTGAGPDLKSAVTGTGKPADSNTGSSTGSLPAYTSTGAHDGNSADHGKGSDSSTLSTNNGGTDSSSWSPHRTDPAHDGWQPPAPTGSGAGPNGVVVTPDMILRFAKQLRDCAGPLHNVEHGLAGVNSTRPGAFQDGDDLKKHIGSGRDGRVKDVVSNVHRVREQLDKVATKLTELAHKYSTTEELNKHLVQDLTPIIGSFSSGLSLGSGSSTGTSGGGGGSGSDSSGANAGGGAANDSVHEQVSAWDGGQNWESDLPQPSTAGPLGDPGRLPPAA
nr:hypothetical protein [Streptomyces sp. TLI_235]